MYHSYIRFLLCGLDVPSCNACRPFGPLCYADSTRAVYVRSSPTVSSLRLFAVAFTFALGNVALSRIFCQMQTDGEEKKVRLTESVPPPPAHDIASDVSHPPATTEVDLQNLRLVVRNQVMSPPRLQGCPIACDPSTRELSLQQHHIQDLRRRVQQNAELLARIDAYLAQRVCSVHSTDAPRNALRCRLHGSFLCRTYTQTRRVRRWRTAVRHNKYGACT